MLLFGYAFVPVHKALHVGMALVIIILLTIDGLRCRNDQTISSSIVNAILPLIALFFVVFIGMAHDGPLYILLSAVTIACSMVLLFACIHIRFVKVVLGVTYVLITVVLPILIFLWTFMIVSSPPDRTEIVQADLSPNGVHLAEVIESRGVGDRGGTSIDVSRRDRDINILVGVFRPVPQRVFEYPPIAYMELHWETDDILYVTVGNRPSITIRFERLGRVWVQS